MPFSFLEIFGFLSRSVDQWGYWVVFLLLLLVAGALASQGELGLFGPMGIAMLAAVLGDNGGYILGRRLGRGFILRHRSRLHIQDHHLDRADGYFSRFGGLT